MSTEKAGYGKPAFSVCLLLQRIKQNASKPLAAR